MIFKYVFWHAWNQTSLYAQYPLEFFDSNHYGPFFSIIIASFYCIEKDITAACFIMIGTFVKLYGIVGLAFFFFSKHKVKFVAALIGWAVLFFVLPMAITSPEYIIDQYKEWHVSLAGKNMENMFSKMQNQSLLGRCAAGVCLHSDDMSPSDLFPAFIRKNYVQPYALKALPCVLIWFKLVYEMMTKDYSTPQNVSEEK